MSCNQISFHPGMIVGLLEGREGVEDSAPKQNHLLAITIVRIRCESVTVNKTLASTTADAFT